MKRTMGVMIGLALVMATPAMVLGQETASPPHPIPPSPPPHPAAVVVVRP